MPSLSSDATLSAAERSTLAGLSERAHRAADAAGAPVLLCAAAALPAQDPLAVLEGLGEPETFRFYWEQQAQGFAIAAGGVARRALAAGAARFADVAAQAHAALSGAVCGVVGDTPDGAAGSAGRDATGPFLLGGFSFFDQVATEDWRGFGAAQLVVPRWLVLRRGESCEGQVALEVPPHGDAASTAAQLAGWLERMRAAAHPVEDAEAGAQRNRAFRAEESAEGRAHWLEIVRAARERIRAGRLTKVVLARTVDIACEAEPAPVGLLRYLRGAYPDCYTFLIDPGAGVGFLGATPERMVRVEGGHARLAALAGTMPRGATPAADAALAQDLLDSPKERSEHRIVVEGIVAAVEDLGHLEWPDVPAVVKLPYAQHLHTPITFIPAAETTLLELLERLHPTAAVGGQPRDEAFALIRDSERFERGWYGAPIGWLNAAGEGEFAVALRAGLLSGTRLRAFAGCGIVADSDPEREYEETRMKLQPLLSALAAE